MSLDHLAYYVPPTHFQHELSFLLASLAHFDIIELQRPIPTVVGLGTRQSGKAWLWVAALPEDTDAGSLAGKPFPVHYAIAASDRKQVDEFHEQGVKAGGKDNGKPGVREMYHKGYYAAFVESPAGVNLEVVYHDFGALRG